jgi:hypothetical protein
VEWYAAQFPGGTEVRGESSPSYSAAAKSPGVPRRMHSLIPDARLLYMVRDPIERMVSQWMHNYSHGREQRPFNEVACEAPYLDRSLYWKQISAFLEYFPRSRILVISCDELEKERRETMRKVFEFLGVDPEFYSHAYDVKMHRSAQKRRKTAVGAWLETTRLARGVEALPQGVSRRLHKLMYYPFSRRIERPALTERDRLEIRQRVQEDTNRFRAFADREFAEWSV